VNHSELMALLAMAMDNGTKEQITEAVDLALYYVANNMGFKDYADQPVRVDRRQELFEKLRNKAVEECRDRARVDNYSDVSVPSGQYVYPVPPEQIDSLDPHNVRQLVCPGYPRKGTFTVTEFVRAVLGDKFNMKCSVSFAQSFAWLVRSDILAGYKDESTKKPDRYFSTAFPAVAQRYMYWATHVAGIAKLVVTEAIPLRARFSLMEYCDWAHINGKTAELYRDVSKFQTVDDEFVYNESTFLRLEEAVHRLGIRPLPLRQYTGRIK